MVALAVVVVAIFYFRWSTVEHLSRAQNTTVVDVIKLFWEEI